MNEKRSGVVHGNSGEHAASGGVVFWLLIFLALSTLAPCLLLPEWRHYQSLREAEQVERHRLELLQREVDRERKILDAMRSDPAAIARLARRDLRFYRPGERVIPVTIQEASLDSHDSFISAARVIAAESIPPVEPPAIIARLASFLPDLDYDRVFCSDETRTILIVQSIALIGVAFVLFRRGF